MASNRRAAVRKRPQIAPVPARSGTPTLGLALGGGGARGFAHVLILEALDELGVKPKIIAGTSIGALVGAAAASGMSGAEIRAYCCELFHKRTEVLKRLFSRRSGGLAALKIPGLGSVFSGENILTALLPEALPARFEGLKIPFLSVTTDFYAQEQYVLTTGPLIPAIAASSALPGVLRPIDLDGRTLIDGGFVNPVPFDLLAGKADTVAAIDVSAGPQQSGGRFPTLIETIIGSNQITLRSVTREKLKTSAPDILIRPDVGRFRVLDFYKIDEIFAASEAAKDTFKRACDAALAGRANS